MIVDSQSSPCLDFWEASPIYQLYPRSFKDCEDPERMYDPVNNPGGICGDGVGDIPGIIEKLDYLSEDLGIKVCHRALLVTSYQCVGGLA